MNKIVGIKLLLARLGVAKTVRFGQKGTIPLFGGKKARVSPLTSERKQFEDDSRAQLLELKKKGLSIPIFTL